MPIIIITLLPFGWNDFKKIWLNIQTICDDPNLHFGHSLNSIQEILRIGVKLSPFIYRIISLPSFSIQTNAPKRLVASKTIFF